MKITVNVTIEITPGQMQAWATRHGIQPTEDAIRKDLPGRDLAPLLNGPLGQIVGVDCTDAALGREPATGGDEHYQEAEQLLAGAGKVIRHNNDTCPEADRMIAEAQVHATLALAAATALNAVNDDDYVPTPDEEAWHEVSGVK